MSERSDIRCRNGITVVPAKELDSRLASLQVVASYQKELPEYCRGSCYWSCQATKPKKGPEYVETELTLRIQENNMRRLDKLLKKKKKINNSKF